MKLLYASPREHEFEIALLALSGVRTLLALLASVGSLGVLSLLALLSLLAWLAWFAFVAPLQPRLTSGKDGAGPALSRGPQAKCLEKSTANAETLLMWCGCSCILKQCN